MNLIGLLDRPTSGDIEIADINTASLSADEAAHFRNRMLGFVFQSFHLLPRISALDNVALPLLYRGIGRTERRELAALMLSRVGLSERRHYRPDELSGGQRQRVAIARALIGRPSLLLADEPTGNLDSKTSQEIMSLFDELNREGISIVLVTHETDIAEHAKRQVHFLDGRIVSDSATAKPTEKNMEVA